jgi:hypothetical protein
LPENLLDGAAKIDVSGDGTPELQSRRVDLKKLEQYSLNPHHGAGRHKARVFRAALGLTIQQAEWLMEQLLVMACKGDAVAGPPSPFGRKYVMDANVIHQGRTAIVRTVWMIENGTDFPRLISSYVK